MSSDGRRRGARFVEGGRSRRRIVDVRRSRGVHNHRASALNHFAHSSRSVGGNSEVRPRYRTGDDGNRRESPTRSQLGLVRSGGGGGGQRVERRTERVGDSRLAGGEADGRVGAEAAHRAALRADGRPNTDGARMFSMSKRPVLSMNAVRSMWSRDCADRQSPAADVTADLRTRRPR